MTSASTPSSTPPPGPSGCAVVTGASRGLGPHIAEQLAADGWPVAINYRSDAASAAAVVDRIRAAGGRAAAFRADVTDEDAVAGLIAAADEQLGPVQVIVANATGPQPEARLDDLTWQAHLDQLEFFVKSPTLLVRSALPTLRASGGGRVILIGSDLADRAAPGWSAYVAAKNAQIGLTKVWAKELGPDQITVNLVQPGWIPVERHAGAETAAYSAEVPLRHMGVPADIATMVAFLASPAANFVTGQKITVNGGHVI